MFIKYFLIFTFFHFRFNKTITIFINNRTIIVICMNFISYFFNFFNNNLQQTNRPVILLINHYIFIFNIFINFILNNFPRQINHHILLYTLSNFENVLYILNVIVSLNKQIYNLRKLYSLNLLIFIKRTIAVR
jgi:hypothetical protein